MRNIFIPIHKGHHFTCVVIFLDKKQISYYDSLLATDSGQGQAVPTRKNNKRRYLVS
jgi:Ulp1 family protease